MFSINQVRHLYVAKTLKSGTALLASDAAGSILPKADKDKTTLWFQYMSPAGIVASDKIDIKSIAYAKATSSDDLAHPLAIKKLTLDADVSATPIAGQEYIVKVAFRSLGEEGLDVKVGMATATTGTTASALYKKLAVSLAKNINAAASPLATIYLATAEGEVKVGATTKESELAGEYTGILVEEVEQPWILGKMPQSFVTFDVQVSPIAIDNIDYIWGKVESVTAKNKAENGKKIADLEYFCAGFKGDEYRGMGYPNNFETVYLVDPSKKYDTLNIHYAYEGSNEAIQKSEKDMTIVCENDGSHTAIKALISAINTAAGLQIANLA